MKTEPRALSAAICPRGLARALQRLQGNLQVLHIRRRALVQDHQVDRELLHPPVFVSLQQLACDRDVVDIVDPQQHDRQVAGNAVAPERRWTGAAATDCCRRRPQRRVGEQHVPRQALEQAGLGCRDAQVPQLHLRLGPGQRAGAHECVGVVVLVEQVQHLLAGRRYDSPEGNACRGAGCHAHPVAQREDRVEYRADGVRKSPSIRQRNRVPDLAATAQESRPVGLDLDGAQHLALDDRLLRHPDLRLARAIACGASPGSRRAWARTRSARRAWRMPGAPGPRRAAPAPARQYDVTSMSRRRPPLFVIERRRTSASSSGDTTISSSVAIPRSVRDSSARSSRERCFVAVRNGAARLMTRRPHAAAFDVAQEQVAARVVTGGVFAPAGDGEVAPAAVARAGRGQHHCIASVRKQVCLRRGVVRCVQPPCLREAAGCRFVPMS